MQQVKSILHSIATNDAIMRILHTFWQAAAGALIAGLLTAKSTADVKLAVATAIAVGLAAIKAALVAKR